MTSPNTAPPHLPWSEALRAVKDVTVDSFDAVLRKSAMALVIFQAPWCAQCKQMAPDVAQVAAAFRSAVIVARVDAEGNDELLDRFDVASYPRILWFDGSNEWPFFASEVRKPEVYHGAKTFKAMATFLEARSGVRAGAREQPAEPPPPPEPPPPSAPPGPPPPLALPPHACSELSLVYTSCMRDLRDNPHKCDADRRAYLLCMSARWSVPDWHGDRHAELAREYGRRFAPGVGDG
jgi:thiol-disulfide isomerase/thioredoxin